MCSINCLSFSVLPGAAGLTCFFKPEVRINPLEIKNLNGTGWEEQLIVRHVRLVDGSGIAYSCKSALEDPTPANVSHQMFSGWTYFPN